MWRSSGCGKLGLILGALVWVAPVSGWAGASKTKAPDQARLREAEELTRDYERLYEEGKYGEAAALAERACAILGEEHGETSTEVAGCLDDLGSLCGAQGDYGRAKLLVEQALTVREKALGPDHSDVAESLNNLASILSLAQGAYGRAEPLYERALAIDQKVLGTDHPDVAFALDNLAALYIGQREYGKAEPLCKRALAIREKTLGPHHPGIVRSLSSLGLLYSEQGEYRKAKPLFERALTIREKALGTDHPDVAWSLDNLASLHLEQGNQEEAELLFERALIIRKKSLSPDHPDVARSLSSLGLLYHERGEYGKAEPLLKQALTIREETLSPDHPEVALGIHNLAFLYTTWGAYRLAEPLCERALAIEERTLDSDHPIIASTIDTLATLYFYRGAYGRAELLFMQALAIRERTLGIEHSDVAASHTNMASLFMAQGAYSRADPLFKRALAIREKALGPSHPKVALTLNDMAVLRRHQGQRAEAESLHERALAIHEKTLGPNHPDTALSLNNLAFLYEDRGAYEEAKALYARALAINEKTLGTEHPHVAAGLNNLANVYSAQGAFTRAEPLYERSLAIKEEVLGPDHPDVALSLNGLGVLYHDQGKHDLALRLRRRALDIEEGNLIRTLIVADEARKLAYSSRISGSLYYALSFHLRVAPANDSTATLALTTLLRRKNRVEELAVQSTTGLRRSLPKDARHLLEDLSDVDSRVAVLSSRGPGKPGGEVHAQQLDELRQERDRLWNELAKHSALVEAMDHRITIRDVQRVLTNSTALIEFGQYAPQHDDAGRHLEKHEPRPSSRYAAYLVFPDRFDWVDLGSAAPIDEHIKNFRKALQTKQAIPTDLYDAVMRPVVDKLGSTHRLVIAPAGALSLVPFAALHDGERYLVEKYELRYVTTGRDLLDPPGSAGVTTTPMTIVANPTGAHLPDAETEADFLEGLFPDTRVLRGKQATETNVRTIERPLILHMATHGFFGEARNERDNPLFRSGLHLADIEQVEVDRERDDGQLTAYEVSGMDLRGTQLVVLSACDTGMGAEVMAEGKVLLSEGVSGLRRAFAMAGARTTVMSLWAVSGVTAQRTMEAYYRKLAEGQGPGEAMQAVQLEMLRTKEHAHPKDWAVFTVSGDDEPLEFPVGQEPRLAEERPPEPGGAGSGCATRRSGHGAPTGSMLIGLLGFTALRRRGR
jgi:tetratricopeptide (TPR) repeat protein/CHAT domain-containing protein